MEPTAAASGGEDPLILVVEDEPKNRAAKVLYFELHGFRAISAESRADAERELRACPLVDMIVTDVNLDDTRPHDTSGLDLAQSVKRVFPNLPLIGYSGIFEPGALPFESVSVFDSIQLKGGDWAHFGRSHLGLWRDRAIAYRQQRTRHAGSELERLNSKYGFSSHDLELLREFVPAAGVAGDRVPTGRIEDVLRDAGYKLRMIEAGRPSSLSDEPVLRRPISVWVKSLGDLLRAEVYGFPNLFAEAESEERVLQKILSLMEGYHKDSAATADDSQLTPELKSYLNQVFG